MAREYFTHKGVLFPCLDYSPEKLSYVENEFQVRDDDIFNITYPKSGTNWMLEILSLIRCDGDPGWVRSVLNWERAPWVENRTGLEAALKYPPPRLLSEHLSGVPSPSSPGLGVHVPGVGSSWPLHSSAPGLEQGLTSGGQRGSWPKITLFRPVGVFPQDLRGSVRRICHFLGKELSEEQVAAVVENASFQSMKGNKMSNYSQLSDEFMDHQNGEFLRKGICGDWRNHLSEAQSQRFDTVYRERMQGLVHNGGSPSPAPQASGHPSPHPAQAGFLLFAHTL
uniref:Sulfotransferase n=1 Tax=Chrysemys picta bellii TaxID=8478 RepID=A0A8C3FI64_CHRPI